ncbi:hypothetical protein RI367_005605 [Sorochytrium milnesiophthora]
MYAAAALLALVSLAAVTAFPEAQGRYLVFPDADVPGLDFGSAETTTLDECKTHATLQTFAVWSSDSQLCQPKQFNATHWGQNLMALTSATGQSIVVGVIPSDIPGFDVASGTTKDMLEKLRADECDVVADNLATGKGSCKRFPTCAASSVIFMQNISV